MLLTLLLLASSSTSTARGVPAGDEVSIPTLIVATASSIALTFIVLKADERRLSREQRSRAWLPASQMVAYLFAPFSLLVHFVRTRRSVVGTLFGALVVVCVSVAVELVARATEWLVTL